MISLPGEITLIQHFGDLLETFLYPGSDGQLRTPNEEEQTISLYTNDLTTVDFKPAEALTNEPKKEATQSVLEYFQQKK